ncbi:hypothetical protein MAHJHV55_52210 [Mycobacterium avium subsp. hominissuis]
MERAAAFGRGVSGGDRRGGGAGAVGGRDAGGIVYPGFPADVLYEFRLVSLTAQLVLWTGIGLVFAAVSDTSRNS